MHKILLHLMVQKCINMTLKQTISTFATGKIDVTMWSIL